MKVLEVALKHCDQVVVIQSKCHVFMFRQLPSTIQRLYGLERCYLAAFLRTVNFGHFHRLAVTTLAKAYLISMSSRFLGC